MVALQLLGALGANKCTFQTFDDNADRKKQNEKLYSDSLKSDPQNGKKLKKDPYAIIRHGTLQQHWKTLCEFNAKGAGIFVTINETDLRGGYGREHQSGARCVPISMARRSNPSWRMTLRRASLSKARQGAITLTG